MGDDHTPFRSRPPIGSNTLSRSAYDAHLDARTHTFDPLRSHVLLDCSLSNRRELSLNFRKQRARIRRGAKSRIQLLHAVGDHWAGAAQRQRQARADTEVSEAVGTDRAAARAVIALAPQRGDSH